MSFNSKSLPPPTAEQKRRWELIRESGCLCCVMHLGLVHYTPAEIHHLKSGNLRMGHDYTIGLCTWHHRGDPSGAAFIGAWFGPSLANGSETFHAHFGTDDALLRYQNELIGWTKEPRRERKRKSKCTRSSKTVPRRGYAR